MKTLTIIQARYNSKRFPGKILKKYKKETMLSLLYKRLSRSRYSEKTIVALTHSRDDLHILKECKKKKIPFFIGSEEDVIDRFYNAGEKFKAKNIVRITADCPVVDSNILDEMLKIHINGDYDLTSNVIKLTFPDGLDIEIMKSSALKKAWLASRKNKKLQEHVTTYFYQNRNIKKYSFTYKKNLSKLRFTLDYPEDLVVIKNLLNKVKSIYKFGIRDIDLISQKHSFFKKNIHYKRNMGSKISDGQKLWSRAKSVIPGGTQLFSKNPDLFLPDKWPVYFSKAKGCFIWDLEGNKFTDMCFMGVGTNVLGYANINVDKKVIAELKKGNLTTLNTKYEIDLAEKLISLHPWLDMVRFTRSGGEANAVAVRIARAASNKPNIAICGYHGWHDWYLASNLGNKTNLDNHLMKNLPIDGVSKNLKNTVFPFKYNDFESFKKIVSKNKIGIVKMEVTRNEPPKNNFLKKIRALCDKKNIILIFDECTTGFRETLGGVHKKFKVKPDMVIFGKALGNGYPINAILGKKIIMQCAEDSFISSTFWSEKNGFVAALETISQMEKLKPWEHISKIGLSIKKEWKKISKKNQIKVDIMGTNAIPTFVFRSKDHLKFKTYISQEMLKFNILASNTIYISLSHNKKILKKYFKCLNKIFTILGKCENKKLDIDELLEHKVCISGMRNK